MNIDTFRTPFPGTQLELDLLTVIARIEQVHRDGVDTCGGVIFDRLMSCDVPRLWSHVGPRAQEWATTPVPVVKP